MNTSSTYLTPPQPVRPAPKRLLSLQARPSPYPYPASLSPTSPSPSGSSGPKRPKGMMRSHSFCASSPNTPYALASTSSCSQLSADKSMLIAPPLERTLSSMGSRGNRSTERMVRPVLSESQQNIPKILIHPSTTPPRRPSIHPCTPLSACGSTPALVRDTSDSRSSSYGIPLTPVLDPSTVLPIRQAASKKAVEDVHVMEEGIRELLV